jgi:predicted nucleotidyltransferase
MSVDRYIPNRYRQPYRYSSPNIPLSAIRRFAQKIAQRFHPEKIILFGSYAYGKPHEESDVDLMVIMPARNVVDQALRINLAFERPFSLDVHVRTPKQIERRLKAEDRDWFLYEVITKGKILYESPHSRVGPQSRRGLDERQRTGGSQTSAPRRRLLSLPANPGKVPQGTATKYRLGRTANP